MTGALDQQDDASTPLSAEEKEGLIPAYITMRRELNEAEQANVANAENWAFRRKRDVCPGASPAPGAASRTRLRSPPPAIARAERS